MTKLTTLSTMFTIALLAACATPSGDDVDTPDVLGDDVDTLASITWNGFTASALSPTTSFTNAVRASATFTGTGTTKMGVCLLRMTTTACSGNDALDATGYTGPCSAAISLPAGGHRYCTNPNNSGQKYCAYRPGSQTSYCAGSPAQGGAAVGAGTYYTPYQGIPVAPTQWVSYGCFIGCNGVDPSVSSASTTTGVCSIAVPPGCNAASCQDRGCDGTLDYCTSRTGMKMFC